MGEKKISAFIHLSPRGNGNSKDHLSTSNASAERLKSVFLLASHLGTPLRASASSRPAFLSIISLDGKLGLGASGTIDPVIGGYAGLTKTLRLEWPEVFCRTIDIHPDIDPEKFVEIVNSELHDPDLGIAEVGYTQKGRFTIIAE